MTTDVDINRARIAVTAGLCSHGFLTGTFVSRIPDFKSALSLSNSGLGLSLLISSIGVLTALGPMGKVAAKRGSASVAITSSFFFALAPFLVTAASTPLWFSVALFIFGFVGATQDLTLNAHGVTLEQKSGRRFMGRFHAFWSLGGLTGTAFGGALAQIGFSTFAHFALVSALLVILGVINSRLFLPTSVDIHEYADDHKEKKKRPRLIFIMGLLGLAGSIGEGAAADWGGVLARETFGASHFVSALPYVAFSAMMVTGRFFGDQIATKFGPNRLLRVAGLLGGSGMALGLVIGGPVGIIAGWFLFGIALSTVIPLLFSAAGAMATKRFAGVISPSESVAMISGISYFGFLVGPPMMGFLADAISLRWAMLVPAALAIVISASSKVFTSE